MILNNIADMVGKELKVNIYQKTRKQKNVFARSVYYRLAREFTPYSLQRIADIFDKDHATALHGFRMFDNFKIQPNLYQHELAAYKTIKEVLKKVKVKKNQSHLEVLINEKQEAINQRDKAVEEQQRVKNKLNRLVAFLNGKHKTDAYTKYAEL